MAEDKYESQKKYLSRQKQLRVWMDTDKYERFKTAANAKGSSVYSEVNRFVDEYLQNFEE